MKSIIRNEILTRRISHKNAEEDSKKIAQKFINLPQLKKAKNILLYYPHKNEVDTRPIIDHLLNSKTINLFLPKVQDQELIPVRIKDLSSLKKGYAGIMEPEGESISPEKIDIIVVPAIAFDKRGHRIGYGKGYYDRFLKKTKALKVGVAYDFQIVDKLPYEQHDIPVDLIITPTRIIKTKEDEKR
ncbi:5-formyltetrahydrofolate cyclo-ligase [Persephonella hydrogeniphila]|uniref:5-formyltetrahydrofolate cyclo-ligase n=1 Tax=Persephonella hydrogeniphila TaxID=198703 RepID=A0A285NJL4_9AQUI|nr:5-formyltetrahydrofolate cyclo-ligase [Persephonella hydrogeniphila]SNZ09645.1 5-formyltetrahydrofolate cyclo-ligase [Persephonella hydrogeniphila]